MNIALVLVGVAFWIAVYAFAVVVAVHQYDDTKRSSLRVLACKASPYLVTLLFNGVIELRYGRGLTNFLLSTAMGFALTWVIVAAARKQWPRGR